MFFVHARPRVFNDQTWRLADERLPGSRSQRMTLFSRVTCGVRVLMPTEGI